MKPFRKTLSGLFICEECQKEFKSLKGLGPHIKKIHKINVCMYYDKWLKESLNEGICKTCDNKTNFINLKNGYYNFCCNSCTQKNEEIFNKIKNTKIKKYGNYNNMDKIKSTKLEKYNDENYNNVDKNRKTNLERFGVEYPMQSIEIQNKSRITRNNKYENGWYDMEHMKESKFKNHGDENYNNKEKIKQTKKERYDNEFYINPEKIKQTCQEKWGVDNPYQSEECKEKSKKTCMEHFRVEFPMQSEEVKEKSKETCLEKYGVDYPAQNPEILEKQQKSAKRIKYYKDTNLYYQGSYEFDFLEKYYEMFKDEIRRGPTIHYYLEGKRKWYFPDFYIPSLNLIVEIKGSYWYDEIIDIAKEKYTRENEYDYMMIIDKSYNNLFFILNSLSS